MWLSHLIYILVWGELVRGQVATMNSSVIGRNNASLSVPLHGHSRGCCILILGLRKLRHSVLLVHHHVVLINLSPRTLTTLRIPPHIIPNIQPSLIWRHFHNMRTFINSALLHVKVFKGFALVFLEITQLNLNPIIKYSLLVDIYKHRSKFLIHKILIRLNKSASRIAATW